MRSLLAILFAVSVVPVPALAATSTLRPPMDASKCPAGSSTEAPTQRSASFDSNTNQATAQKFLNTAVYCPNACYDLQVTLTLTTSLQVNIGATNRCSSSTKAPNDPAQNPKRGCASGETKPQISITTKDIFSNVIGFHVPDQTVTRSRCDSSAIDQSVKQFVGGLSQAMSNPAQAQSQMIGALQNFGSETDTVDLSARSGNNLDAALEGDKNASAAILQSFGLSSDQANAAIENNPDKVNQILQCLQTQGSCDPQEFEKTVDSLGVKLNPDLAQQAMLHPEQFVNGSAKTPSSGDQAPSAGTTFDQSQGAGSSIVDNLSSMCYQPGMGGCGSACNVSAPSLTCRTNNPGAIVCSSVASRFGAIGCDPNNNTAVFPTIEAGIAAQASLLTSNARYFASGNNTILGAFCNGYSTSNCSEYAAFISNQTGIPMNQTIDPNNAQQIGAIMMASSRFENGHGVIYTPDQLQNGLLAAYGQASLPTGTNGYVSQTYNGTNGGVQFGSPYYLGYGSTPATVAGAFGSPFANAIPIGYAAPPPPSYTAPTPTQTTPATPIQYTGPAPTNFPAVAPHPVATLLAQPSSTTKGESVLLSWSTAGIASNSCSLTMGSTTIAQGNEGSKRISTDASFPDLLTFLLSCTAEDGTSIQQSTSVTLH